MKKLVYLFGVILLACGCQVRHDHSKQVQSVLVDVDTAQKNSVDEERAKIAAETKDDEGVYVMPKEPVQGDWAKKSSMNVDEEIERMMKGEDTSGE